MTKPPAKKSKPAEKKKTAKGCPVVHWEFLSKNPAALGKFYEKIFGWKIQPVPELKYNIVNTCAEAGIKGGIVKPECEGPWPGNMTFYVAVDDLARYRKRVAAAGGKILIEEQEVKGMGSFCLFMDPEKRMIGLWKSENEDCGA